MSAHDDDGRQLRIVWEYADKPRDAVARTEWIEADAFDRERLKHAGREGVVLWDEGEPLEDAMALTVGTPGLGGVSLEVEYLHAASAPGGATRHVRYRIESRQA